MSNKSTKSSSIIYKVANNIGAMIRGRESALAMICTVFIGVIVIGGLIKDMIIAYG